MTSLKILVVDDNQNNCDILCTLFTALKHDTAKAYEGMTAIQKALQWIPDIILLDIEMPGMLGWDVCRKLRTEKTVSHTKIYALTGLSDIADIQRSFDCGMEGHFVKPLDFDQFWKVLGIMA